jgi:hypothetical protein
MVWVQLRRVFEGLLIVYEEDIVGIAAGTCRLTRKKRLCIRATSIGADVLIPRGRRLTYVWPLEGSKVVSVNGLSEALKIWLV